MTVSELHVVNPQSLPLRVVVVDRHPLVARGLQAALDEVTLGRVRVVGRGDAAAGMTDLLRRHRPGVLLVDLDLPGGLAAIAAARRLHPTLRIAAMAPEGVSVDVAEAALAAGANGVLVRGAAAEDVAAHLLALVGGAAVIPPKILSALVRRRPLDEPARHLRPVDLELWRMVAEDRDTTAIAARFGVSERTAKRLVARLLQRIGVSSRLQAAALAGRCGLLDQPGEIS